MSTIIQSKMTAEEYLAFLETSTVKYEYLNGELREMGGTTDDHSAIVIRLVVWLSNALRGTGYRIRAGDTIIQSKKSGLYTFSDVCVVPGPPQFDDQAKRVLMNPALIIEVLSRSTQKYDRGEKFEHYKQIESFQEYLLIDQKKTLVEQFQRQPDGSWNPAKYNQLSDIIPLPSIGRELPLSVIYEDDETPPIK